MVGVYLCLCGVSMRYDFYQIVLAFQWKCELLCYKLKRPVSQLIFLINSV